MMARLLSGDTSEIAADVRHAIPRLHELWASELSTTISRRTTAIVRMLVVELSFTARHHGTRQRAATEVGTGPKRGHVPVTPNWRLQEPWSG